MLAPERLDPRSRTSARPLAFRRSGTQPAAPGQGGIHQCFPSAPGGGERTDNGKGVRREAESEIVAR